MTSKQAPPPISTSTPTTSARFPPHSGALQSSPTSLNQSSPTSPTYTQQSPSPSSHSRFFCSITQRVHSPSRQPEQQRRVSSPPSPQQTSTSRPKKKSRPRNHSSSANPVTMRRKTMPATTSAAQSQPGSNPLQEAPTMKRSVSERSDWDRMCTGRHSGEWLFNGYHFRNLLKRQSTNGS